jgi:hypothetical protein
MEHEIKLPKNLNIGKLSVNFVPETGSWASVSGKKYLYLCRARDRQDTEGTMGTYWVVGLFAGGEVKLGKLQYRILSINTSNDKPSYSDEYTIAYDEAELVTVPCIYFDEDTECFKGEVIGFFKDGDCAVVKAGDLRVIKLDPSKVKYISDILDME